MLEIAFVWKITFDASQQPTYYALQGQHAKKSKMLDEEMPNATVPAVEIDEDLHSRQVCRHQNISRKMTDRGFSPHLNFHDTKTTNFTARRLRQGVYEAYGHCQRACDRSWWSRC